MVDASESQLVVVEVMEGLVASWNAANPKLQIVAGACILEVNGTKGKPQQLLDLMMRDASPTMLIKPSRESRQVSSSHQLPFLLTPYRRSPPHLIVVVLPHATRHSNSRKQMNRFCL